MHVYIRIYTTHTHTPPEQEKAKAPPKMQRSPSAEIRAKIEKEFKERTEGVASLKYDYERECFIDKLLVRIHFIIVMIRWTGLAPWEFEFSFSR